MFSGQVAAYIAELFFHVEECIKHMACPMFAVEIDNYSNVFDPLYIFPIAKRLNAEVIFQIGESFCDDCGSGLQFPDPPFREHDLAIPVSAVFFEGKNQNRCIFLPIVISRKAFFSDQAVFGKSVPFVCGAVTCPGFSDNNERHRCLSPWVDQWLYAGWMLKFPLAHIIRIRIKILDIDTNDMNKQGFAKFCCMFATAVDRDRPILIFSFYREFQGTICA